MKNNSQITCIYQKKVVPLLLSSDRSLRKQLAVYEIATARVADRIEYFGLIVLLRLSISKFKQFTSFLAGKFVS